MCFFLDGCTRTDLCAAYTTAGVPGIALFCTGSFPCVFSHILGMAFCTDIFCFYCATGGTCVGFDAFFCTGSLFCYSAFVPAMSFYRCLCAVFDKHTTDLTVKISGIAFFCTGSCLEVSSGAFRCMGSGLWKNGCFLMSTCLTSLCFRARILTGGFGSFCYFIIMIQHRSCEASGNLSVADRTIGISAIAGFCTGRILFVFNSLCMVLCRDRFILSCTTAFICTGVML